MRYRVKAQAHRAPFIQEGDTPTAAIEAAGSGVRSNDLVQAWVNDWPGPNQWVTIGHVRDYYAATGAELRERLAATVERFQSVEAELRAAKRDQLVWSPARRRWVPLGDYLARAERRTATGTTGGGS